MNGCQSYEPSIERLLADEIDSAERDRLLAHAESCASCRQFVDLHYQLLDPVLDVELPGDEEFAAARHSVLRQIRAQRSRSRDSWLGLRAWIGLLAARPGFAAAMAVMTVAVLGLGVLLGQRLADDRFTFDGVEGVDPVVLRMSEEAQGNRLLADVENSPFIYSNVSFADLNDDTLSMSFDVTRHVEVVRSKDDPLVQDVLVQSLLHPEPVGTRLQAVSYAARVTEPRRVRPKIREALVYSMLHDPNLAVRMLAMNLLAARERDAGTQSAFMAVLRDEQSVPMRLLAMDYLVAGEQRPEGFEELLEDLRRQDERALLARAAVYK